MYEAGTNAAPVGYYAGDAVKHDSLTGEIDAMRSKLSGLNALIGDLETALAPVMLDAPPEPPGNAGTPATVCSRAESDLRAACNHIEHMVDRLSSIQRRLRV